MAVYDQIKYLEIVETLKHSFRDKQTLCDLEMPIMVLCYTKYYHNSKI